MAERNPRTYKHDQARGHAPGSGYQEFPREKLTWQDWTLVGITIVLTIVGLYLVGS